MQQNSASEVRCLAIGILVQFIVNLNQLYKYVPKIKSLLSGGFSVGKGYLYPDKKNGSEIKATEEEFVF